jgi:hypothetical protein
MNKRTFAGLLLVLAAASAHADDMLDVTAGLLYDSNVPRAQLERDIKSDTAFQAALAWGRFLPLADGLTLRATLDAGGEAYAHYSGLNNLALGSSLSLRQKFGLGALAPWVNGWASGARLDYQDKARDGWRYEFGVGAGKRLSEAWDVEVTYRYQHRTQDNPVAVVPGISGAVFDLQAHQAGLRSEYAMTERISLEADFDYRRGDVASTTQRNFTIFTNSTAIALDPVFGPGAVGYRIYATTQAYRIGLSYALGRDNSINTGIERWISRARGGLDYYNTLVGASYVHAL